jgi:four helix bundle protein
VAFDFEKLKVYQGSLDFVDAIYGLTRGFPRAELMELTRQIRHTAA